MIKFFRNIRKKLLEQGKMVNYLKYAIGEIVLVVIGILIALQINNWNEERKMHIKSYAYLQRLNEDAENVLKNVQLAIIDTERKQRSARLVLESLESKELPAAKQNDFDRYLKEYFQFHITVQNVNTFNEMISSGDLNLIKNKWLRNAFSDLSSYRDFVMEVNQSNHNAYKINSDLFQKYVRYHVENVDTDSKKVTTSYHFDAMAGDSIFINQISNQSYTWYDISRMYKGYATSVEQIGDTIQLEIKKYDK